MLKATEWWIFYGCDMAAVAIVYRDLFPLLQGEKGFAVKQLSLRCPCLRGTLLPLEETILELLWRCLSVQNFSVDVSNAKLWSGRIVQLVSERRAVLVSVLSTILPVSVRGEERGVKACQLYLNPKSPVC